MCTEQQIKEWACGSKELDECLKLGAENTLEICSNTRKKNDAEQESKLEFETKNGKNAPLGFGDVNFKMGPVGGMDL